MQTELYAQGNLLKKHFCNISMPMSWKDHLNGWTNHLNKTIKHTCPFSFKRFPVRQAFINCESCNRLALTEAHIFYYTFHESLNILLQQDSRLFHPGNKIFNKANEANLNFRSTDMLTISWWSPWFVIRGLRNFCWIMQYILQKSILM